MFAKLLKYEWKASVRVLTILALCALGLAVLCGLDIRFIGSYLTGQTDDSMVLLFITAFFFLYFAYIGFILYASAGQLILLIRFYKTRFTDEGYLTFTLPVKTSHIYLSSMVNMLIWQTITTAVLILCVLIAIVIGLPWNSVVEFFTGFPEVMGEILSELPIIGYLAAIPLAAISSVLIPMSAIVIGSVLVKRLKLLASFGIMYGVSTVAGIIGGAISLILAIVVAAEEGDPQIIFNVSPLLSTLFSTLLGVAGYIISIRLMKTKLNLS